MNIEHVRYECFVVRFTLADGRRRRLVRWSPGYPWVYEEITRELMDMYDAKDIKPGSCTITPEPKGKHYR